MYKQSIAFWGKSWQLLIGVFLFAVSAHAQTLDTARVRQGVFANPGYDYIGLGISRTLRPPQDTIKQAVRDSGAISVKNGMIYIWNGRNHIPSGGSDNGIATGSRKATADYVQNWNRHQLIFDTTKNVRIYSNAPDWNFTNNIHTFLFEHYNSVIGPPPLSLKWSLRNVTNSSDSVGGGIISDLYSTTLSHNTGSQSGQLYLSDGSAQLAAFGSKTSTITAYNGTITIDAPDSTQIRLKASASAAGDSMVVTRNFGFGLNTLVKVPMPAGGGTTNLDSARTDTTVTVISSTGTDALIAKADTLKAGVMSASDKKKLDKIEIVRSSADLRIMNNISADVIYRIIQNKIIGDYYWDATSTATDDSVMVIQRTGITTGRFLRYFEDYILVDWFGAVANDGLDDWAAWQKAVNFAIASPKGPSVQTLGGRYNLSHGINIFKKSGIQYTFVTLKIEGRGFLVNPATILEIDNLDGFGIMVMVGRQVEISNITFEGGGPNAGQSQVVTWSTADWTSTGVRNNQFSPQCGVGIDGYNISVSSGNRYPDMLGMYTNTQTGGTSQLTLYSCTFKRLPVGVANNTSGAMANGDNIRAIGCNFESVKSAWVCGQTQSRGNSIENSYFLFSQYAVDGINYGSQQGTPPTLTNCNFAGALKYVYALNGSFSAMTIDKCYFESLFSLGKSDAMPVTFVNCEVVPNHDNSTFTAPLFGEGNQVSFIGGRIGYFDNLSNMALPFKVNNLSFRGVSLLCLPVNMDANYFNVLPNKTVFDNVSFIGANQVGMAWESNVYNSTDVSNMFGNSPIIMPGSRYVYDIGTYSLEFQSKSPKITANFVESKTLNIDTTTATAYFLSSDATAYQLNDVLTTASSVIWSGNEGIYSTNPTIIGEVYAKSNDTIRVKYLPYGLDETTTYSLVLTRIPHIVPKFFGNVTSGSNSITSCHFSTMSPQVGDWINSDYLPVGTRITNISGSTVTISRNATGTITGTEFKDATIQIDGKSPAIGSVSANPIGFSLGDRIYNNRASNDSTYVWVCDTSGFPGGTPGSHFDYVNTGSSGGGSVSFNAVGSSPNANGGSATGSAITLQPADATHPGVMSATTQDFGGTKNFNGDLSLQTSATNNTGRAGLSLWGDPGSRRAFLICHGINYFDPDLDSTTVLMGAGASPTTGMYMINGPGNLFMGNFASYSPTGKKITMGGTTAFLDKVYINSKDSVASPANMAWVDPSNGELKISAVPSGAYSLYYSDTSATTVTNTTTQSTLIGNVIGSTSFDGGTLAAGSKIILKGYGYLNTDAVTPGNLEIDFTVSNYTLGIVLSTLLPVGLSNADYEYEFEVSPFTLGTNKDIFYKGNIIITNNATGSSLSQKFNGKAVMTTTGTLSTGVTAQWSIADSDNSVISRNNTLEVKRLQ
jgi:hypothetical protein